jgi:hypothetical protein
MNKRQSENKLPPNSLSGRNAHTSLRHNQHNQITKPDNVLRFLRFINDKVGLNDCWEWNGTLTKDGYGSFWLNGKTLRAHRASWILFEGEIPEGLQVLHKCDNPLCVRTAHLFLGTTQENTADRNKKNRQAKGEIQGASKLSSDEVAYIRKNYRRGNGSILARTFNVSPSAISCITTGKYWRHINE